MRPHPLLIALVLLLPSTVAHVASADPVEDGAGAATEAASYAHAELVNSALDAHADGIHATSEAHAAVTVTALDAHRDGVEWTMRSHRAAVEAFQGHHGQLLAHGQDGIAFSQGAVLSGHAALWNASTGGLATGTRAAFGAHAAGVELAAGAHSGALYLTEDAHSWAVRNTFVIHGAGVTTLYDLIRSDYLTTEEAYGLVFNPVALVDYLQEYDDFDEWTLVRAPSPADAERQAALALASARTFGSGESAIRSSLHLRPGSDSVAATSACGDGTTAMANSRVWALGIWRSWRNFGVGEYGEIFEGSAQFANYPFGKGCGTEWATWHADAFVSGRANDDVPVGYPAFFDVHLRLVGSETEAYHPAMGETATFRYGYGQKSAPLHYRPQVRDPVLFLEDKSMLEAKRDLLRQVAIGSNDITDAICEYECPLLKRFRAIHPFVYAIAERVDSSGILSQVKRLTMPVATGIASTALYLASKYYTQPELDGRPGIGVRFVTAHVGANDEPVHLFARLGGEYLERGHGSSRIWFRTGYWGEWRTAAAEDGTCDDWRSCQVMTGNEAIGVRLFLRNGDE